MHLPERPLPAPPSAPRRANPLATLSLILALLGTAGALLIWGTQLDKTGLAGGLGALHFVSFEGLWTNFLHLVAWWAGSLLCPLLALVSGHSGLRRVEERQESVTTGGPIAWVGLSLGYGVLILSTGMLLVSFLIHCVTSLMAS